jgi:hypothetical protein
MKASEIRAAAEAEYGEEQHQAMFEQGARWALTNLLSDLFGPLWSDNAEEARALISKYCTVENDE